MSNKKGGKPPKTKSKDIAKLLASEPENLTDENIVTLLRDADRLYGDDGEQWMDIGHRVFKVMQATPGLSREAREQQFDQGLDRLPYQTGLKAKRVYENYQDSPDEVIDYGLDLADRIKGKPKPERVALLKEHGSPRKVRAALKGDPEQVEEHRLGLGDHDDIIGALRSQSEEVVMDCSLWGNRIRSVLKKNKPLSQDFEHEFHEDHDLISAEPVLVAMEDGRVVIELKCTKAEAKARAAIISACLGFEYLQRLIHKKDRLI